ncbi:MAG: hypothetical protein ABSG13_24065 [Bryobacteraceae bacterium]|jgi:hypothetical protein
MNAWKYQIPWKILSILLAGCIGSIRGGGTILEVLVEMGVLLALFLAADGGSLRMRGIQVCLPGGF